MGKNSEKNITPEAVKPKDALEYRFERAMQRAITSPVLSANQENAYIGLVDAFPAPPYWLCVGLAVEFRDSSDFQLNIGSYYPFWAMSCGFITKRQPPTNVKLKLVPKQKTDQAVELCNRFIKMFGNAEKDRLMKMTRTATNFNWFLPFSDREITRLGQGYQDIIRRDMF